MLVAGLPGDRRDKDLVATIEATLPFASEYVFYDLTELRGRAPRELPTLLAASLPDQPAVRVCSERDRRHRARLAAGWAIGWW